MIKDKDIYLIAIATALISAIWISYDTLWKKKELALSPEIELLITPLDSGLEISTPK